MPWSWWSSVNSLGALPLRFLFQNHKHCWVLQWLVVVGWMERGCVRMVAVSRQCALALLWWRWFEEGGVSSGLLSTAPWRRCPLWLQTGLHTVAVLLKWSLAVVSSCWGSSWAQNQSDRSGREENGDKEVSNCREVKHNTHSVHCNGLDLPQLAWSALCFLRELLNKTWARLSWTELALACTGSLYIDRHPQECWW